MIYPFDSKFLNARRLDVARGLRTDWTPNDHLMRTMQTWLGAPDERAAQQRMHDLYDDALNCGHAFLVDDEDLTVPGHTRWNGRPVCLEFARPMAVESHQDYRAAVVLRHPVGAQHLLLVLFLSPTSYVSRSVAYLGQVADLLPGLAGDPPLRAVVTALTRLPDLSRLPLPHEPTPVLLERLTPHLRQVKRAAPRALGQLWTHFASDRSAWSPQVFVPTTRVANDLRQLDGLDWMSAVTESYNVGVLGAWRYAKHVVRIDPDVLHAMRAMKPLDRIPGHFSGWPGHAIYVPVPGGLHRPSQRGFFAAIDEVDGRQELILLLETRIQGRFRLVPMSLPLGGDFQTEVTQTLGWGGASSDQALMEESVQDIRFALLLLAYLSSQAADLSGPPSPLSNAVKRLPPREASGFTVWKGGEQTGQRLRAYRVNETRQTSPRSAAGSPGQSGRKVAPHLRSPHLHGYWTGPGRTQLEVKLLDFIAVNLNSSSDHEGEAPVRLRDR